MKKTMMHEIGHTVGYMDANGACGSQSSVMNTFCDVNEEGNGNPSTPSQCDKDWAQGAGSCTEPEPDPPVCGTECFGDPDCEECECEQNGDWLYDAEGFPHCESPILISLRSNTAQYHLTSLDGGVQFDINGDGTQDQVAWTAAGSSVGFLAMDRNGNGIIDSGAELFGNHTRKRNGTRAKHGFEALADLEDPLHADGTITSTDEAYSKLLLWIDSNHDGLSSLSELSSLSQAGIARLDTSYVTRRRRDQYGNRYRYEGTALILEDGKFRSRRMFDVFFMVKR